RQRHADRIRVVAVRVVAVAGEVGLQSLDAGLARRQPDPVARRGHAQSVKTLVRRGGHGVDHAHRSQPRGPLRDRNACMETLPSFILAGVALTGSPGPNTLGLAAASAAYGLRGSLMLLGGAIVGVYAVILATATGLTGLVLAQPGAA